MSKKNTYTAKDIEILEGLEPVRKRPGMYIGNTNYEGLHHLVNEVVDNSIDEVLAGHANKIFIHYSDDKFIKIKDDGRGIPIDFHPKYKNKRALEVVLTKLHSGGKFTNKSYKTSGGLHGVGLSVVNALSELLEVSVYKKGKKFIQKYKRGKPQNKIKIIKCNKKEKGTEIRFKPDNQIFENINLEPEKLFKFLQAKAFLVKGTQIDFKIDKELLKNSKIAKYSSFKYKNGIIDYYKEFLFKEKNQITIFHAQLDLDKKEKCEVFVSFNENIKNLNSSYCNTINTPDGGSHENALKNSILKAFKEFGKKNQLSKILNISINDIFDFSDSIISIFINEPSFEGQTKKRVNMPKIQKILEEKIYSNFFIWLNQNKKISLKLANIFIERSLERTDFDKIKELERKSFKEKSRLPGKLVDCSSLKKENTEIFIVEGDSAGGSAKQARYREKQAVLPLRGKILNVQNVSLSKIADNTEIQNLIQALGCGIGKNFEIKKLRYEKIILMTDADVDGSHIATLLITFFYRFMKGLITNECLFLALPPLYKITNKNLVEFAYNEKEKENIINKKFKKNNDISITRFKGLGEMPAQQLRDTTMDVNKRNLLKISIKDVKKDMKKIDKIFETLMGKKADERYKFIRENANFTKNLDY